MAGGKDLRDLLTLKRELESIRWNWGITRLTHFYGLGWQEKSGRPYQKSGAVVTAGLYQFFKKLRSLSRQFYIVINVLHIITVMQHMKQLLEDEKIVRAEGLAGLREEGDLLDFQFCFGIGL